MVRLLLVQLGKIGSEIVADNLPKQAGAEPYNAPTAALGGESDSHNGLALIATLRAEIAASYHNFDTIVRRLGYDKG
jgi:hypothetical protein